MVLLDENFDATEIHEADWKKVIAALTAPGSKARNERGALAAELKSAYADRIGKGRWTVVSSWTGSCRKALR